MYFWYFRNYAPPKPSKMDNYFFETKSQNGPISVKWKHQSHLIFCILRLSHKHITFDSSRGRPCISGPSGLNKKYTVKIFLNWGNKTQAYDFHIEGFLIYHINGNTLYKKKYLEISPSKGQIGLRKRNIFFTNSIPFCKLHRLTRRWFLFVTNWLIT